MIKKTIVILLVSLSLASCGRREKQAPGDNTLAPDQTPASATEFSKGDSTNRLFIINLVYNTESLGSETDLVATPVLENPGEEFVEFRFQWFVNGKEEPGVHGGVLEKRFFKKNDWLYCKVKAIRKDEISNVFRADYIRVPNTPPELVPAPIPAFTLPGTFSYQIQARDIDNDPLTYKLLSPLDQGIEVNEKTGLLNWEIDKTLASKLTSPAVITFEVSDPDGGKVTSAITLNFAEVMR